MKISEEDFKGVDQLTRLAIADALRSYDIISKGGELKVKKDGLIISFLKEIRKR
ncbi:hypothetical protein ACI2OX_12070 [Bacillus sp. N9]